MNNEILWSKQALASVFSREGAGADVSGISIDTRTLKPGDLFIALAGDPATPHDGHDYLETAAGAGAAAALVHQPVSTTLPTIMVEDTFEALWTLAGAARSRFTGKTLAITGSSGKTTLRLWFEFLLNKVATCHASTGSLNNKFGVPLSLARAPADRDFGVFEIGTNHPGEIAPLSGLVRPDVSLLLNVLPAHIGNFADMDALRQEKLTIAAGLSADGVLVLPTSLRHRAGHNRCLTFGENGDVTAEAGPIAGGTQLRLNVCGESIETFLPMQGPERVESVLALFATFYALGVNLQAVSEHLAALPLPEGRGNRHQLNDITVVDDSYNANPASMAMSLAQFDSLQGLRKIAFLGEMLELGSESETSHADAARQSDFLDQVYTFGADFAGHNFTGSHRHYDSVDQFDLSAFVAGLEPGDCILVKGSNAVFWKHNFVKQLMTALQKTG